MSAEAMGHALRFSPHKGATFTILLAIADSVNDQYGYEFWMAAGNLARKSRTTRRTVMRSLSELEADGWLVRLTARLGESVRYRYVIDDAREVMWDSRSQGYDEITHPPVTVLHTGCDEVSHKPKENPSNQPKQNPILGEVAQPFDDFWAAYPRKKGKGQAERAWTKACKHTDPGVIISAAVAFYQQCIRDGVESQFVPYPATWLNGERWLDEPDTLPDTPQSNTQGWLSLARDNAYTGNHEVVPELEAGAPWT